MTKSAFFGNQDQIDRVYALGRKEQVAAATDLYPVTVNLGNFEEHASRLGDLEVVFTTWGMPALTAEHLDRLPALKAVFYGAGSVQGFARPFLEHGITVMSAWHANGIPVAEFTLAQILLASKGYFRNRHDFRGPELRGSAFRGKGNFGEMVALLGAGAIGRKLIELLRPFSLDIAVFDPFLSDMDAVALGVRKVGLDEAFSQAYIVSNHLANNPQTVKMLRGDLFARMRSDATFINTGRGHTVDEPGMIQVLTERPDLTALLDVTHPEPPVPDSPLYTLPNVHLTSHIAGSIGDEVVRMADYCLEDFARWQKSEPLQYAVTVDMLEKMA